MRFAVTFVLFAVLFGESRTQRCKDSDSRCQTSSWKQYCHTQNMKDTCMLSCGVCDPNEPNQCQDNDRQCPSWSESCNLNRIKKLCPKTCGSCPECKDSALWCASNQDLCSTKQEVRETCKKTCEMCGGGGAIECKDAASWCRSRPIDESSCRSDKIVQDACKRTCNLCGGGHPHPCNQNPCENGGTCIKQGQSYTCNCPPDFTGQNCKTECKDSALWCSSNRRSCSTNKGVRDACKKTCEICSGGGKIECKDSALWCKDIDESSCRSDKSVQDACKRKCDLCGGGDPHPCDRRPCENGGTCIKQGQSYTCDCPPNFTGQNCETECKDSALWCSSSRGSCSTNKRVRDACKKTCEICSGGGEIECKDSALWCKTIDESLCRSDKSVQDACKKKCDLCGGGDQHPCDQSPCENGGTCRKQGQSYSCDCPPDFTGQNCEQEICKDKATWCAGYEKDCENNNQVRDTCKKTCKLCGLNTCNKNLCQNGGNCVKQGAGYRCECPKYFSGKTCVTTPVQTGLHYIGQVKDQIISEISDFVLYDYDTESDTYIRDGTADMYDDGNMVSFWGAGEKATQIVYGKYYERGDYEFASTKRWPFTALMFIKNADRSRASYSIKVDSSTGADGRGVLQYFEGGFATHGMNVAFAVTQVYDARDPSICEVYFAFSKERLSYGFNKHSDTTAQINTTFSVNNFPQDAWMGYILLSRYKAGEAEVITQGQVKEVLNHILDALFLLPSSVQERLHRISPQKELIVRSIPGFYPYLYDSISDNAIRDGGHDMFNTGNKVSFWAQGETETRMTYGEHYNRGDYHFASTKGLPFTALMYIRNTEKSRSSYNIKVDGQIGGSGFGSLETFNGVLIAYGKEIAYSVAQFYGAGVPTTCELYFAFSEKKSVKRSFQTNSRLSARKNYNTNVRLADYPQDAWMGYVLLSRNNGELIRQADVESALKILLEGLFDCPVGSVKLALRRVKLVQDLLASAVTSFVFYDYDNSPTKINDNMFYRGGNEVFFKTDIDPITQIVYDSSYNRVGYEVAVIKGWPFVTLMYIDNADRTHSSFSIQVKSKTTHFEGTFANFDGILTIYGVEVPYSVTQSFDKSRTAVCEVYFALSKTGSVKQSFQTQRVPSLPRFHDTTITLGQYPQDAWMGYMLLSRYKGRDLSIPQYEVETSLSRLVRATLDSQCPEM